MDRCAPESERFRHEAQQWCDGRGHLRRTECRQEILRRHESAAGRDVLSEQVKSLQQAEKKAAQAVSQCTSQIAKARDEQKSADLRVQAAEVKLQETIVKSGQSSSQAINAQARLNDARSKARQKTEASHRLRTTQSRQQRSEGDSDAAPRRSDESEREHFQAVGIFRVRRGIGAQCHQFLP